MNKVRIPLTLVLTLSIFFLSGCNMLSKTSLDPKEPITLTMWHVYGSQTESPMNDMIAEFNKTVGKEKGVIINITSVSNSSDIEEALWNAADEVPGAASLPDIFTTYPNAVLQMNPTVELLDFNEYFSKEELSSYVPAFLEEGMIEDKLLVFPLAKSTELMFVDQTLLDRFFEDSEYTMADLQTYDSLWKVCESYYTWSDAQTPDVPNDGTTLFMHNDILHYFTMGLAAQGLEAFDGEQLNTSSEEFKSLWMPYAKAAIYGGVSLLPGYASDPMRTGEVIASVSSSAGILYHSDTVTYEDNTSEKIELNVYPAPLYGTESQNLLYQRGVGLCAVHSDDERKNEAAVLFAQWITESENNLNFTTSAGYLPVTNNAYDNLVKTGVEKIDNAQYQKLYSAVNSVHGSYGFFTPPQFTGYSLLEKDFNNTIRELLSTARQEYLVASGGTYDETLLEQFAESTYKSFCQHFQSNNN